MPNNNLFDSDTLYSTTPLGAKASSPVRCLGKDFKNEEDRRAFFRDELRKQLPELRKLEGFPIGEDDDIIAISDPPYYTACPNPWLNDIIAEWEEDKKALVTKKKRKEGHEVHEPYASDVSEGKNNPIYNAHSYHTKVPHPAIMRYILHYTQPGDIVYDGFAGTGMTGVAAQLCENPDRELKTRIDSEFIDLGLKKPDWGARKAICGDLSPIASFIAYNYNTPVDAAGFEREALRVLAEVEAECGWMYETRHTDNTVGSINYTVWSDVFICSDCSGEIVFWDAAVDKENGQVREEFACPHCDKIQTKRGLGKAMVTVYDQALNVAIRQAKTVPVLINYRAAEKRFEKKPDAQDLELIKKIEATEMPYWFPVDRMPEGDEARRNDAAGVTHVHHFFTKRNLLAISCFHLKIINGNCYTFQLLQMLFGSMRILSKQAKHNMERRVENSGLGWVNAGVMGTLYISSAPAEQSVIFYISKRISKHLSLPNTKNKIVIQDCSASSTTAPDCSIDYVFTDPPFGANIMYSELNFIWESWLKARTDNKSEAIKNDTQGKTLFDYQRLMERCFLEYFRILKSGRWMTVEFEYLSCGLEWHPGRDSARGFRHRKCCGTRQATR